MLLSTFWHVLAESILLIARAKNVIDWCVPVISLTKESTFEHVLTKALLPKAALLDWSAPGLRDQYYDGSGFVLNISLKGS